MANPALAQEQLVALRHAIARIENGTASPVHHDAGSLPAASAGQMGRTRKAQQQQWASRTAPRHDAARDATRDATSDAIGHDNPVHDGPARPAPLIAANRLIIDNGALDRALDGGLRLDGLNEIRSSASRDHGAASSFTLALGRLLTERMAATSPYRPRLLVISNPMANRESGLLHARGLPAFGLAPDQIIHAAPRKLDEAMLMAESALQVACLAAIIFEIDGNPRHFGLTESRRLHLKAQAHGRPLLLLRARGEEEASSARARILVNPAPSPFRLLPNGQNLARSIGNPCFRLTVEKSRTPVHHDIFLEWNPDDHVFSAAPVFSAHHALAADDGDGIPHPHRTAHSGDPLSTSGDRPDRPPALGRVVAFPRAS